MRSIARRTAAAAGAALLSVLVLAPPAGAVPPVDIPPGDFVVDQAGVLGAEVSEVERAVEQLQDDTGRSLFVVYVDEFSSPSDMERWTAAVAENKGLGTADSLLAIAVDTRQARLKSHDNGSVAPFDEEIYSQYIVPELRDDAWAAAGVQAAAGIEAALDGQLGGSGDGGAAGSEGAAPNAAPWIIGGVVVVGGATVWALSRRRKLPDAAGPQGALPGADGRPVDPLAGLSVEELRQRAGSLLIAADDAIKSSEQELGFAMAQYGEAAIKPFSEDLAAAKGHLSESFKLQQQLDDHIPDTEEQQRAWLGDIIRRCEAVNDTLEEHRADFDALRELERKAPEAIAALKAEAPVLRQRLGSTGGTLQALSATYADSALTQVRDNIGQAAERLDFLDNAIETAEAKLAGQNASEAAVAVRAGEEALDQARVLLDAVDKTGGELEQARRDLEAAVGATAQDLAQARALVSSGRNPELAGPAAGVEQALAQVRTQLQAGRVDPVALLASIERAHAELDGPLGSVRDQHERQRRAADQLQAAVRAAQVKIEGTSDYIRARRGGVGSRARTRLAEAQRNLDEAIQLGRTDPVAALQYAHQAGYLAEQAAREAESDVDSFSGGGFGGGGFGGRGGGGFGGGMSGAILGGILIDSILHGGRGGGGHDGGFFGGGGFGGFGGGGGGGFGGGFDGGGGGGNF